MRRLNAVDAISPAWDQTRGLLVTPRSWRLALKICAVACLAQMGGCNAGFNVPFRAIGGHSPWGHVVTMLLVLAGIAGFAIGVGLFYLSSRLQFVLFEMVATSQTRVGPIWRRYGAATWRWMGLKALFFIGVVVCTSPLLVPAILFFVRTATNSENGAKFGPFFGAFLGFFAAIFLWVVVVSCCYVLLADFGLPSMALEGTSMKETARRVVALVRGEAGQVALYLILRWLLGMACAIACYMTILALALVLALPLGAAGFGAWMAWRHANGAEYVLMFVVWGVLGLIFLAALFVAGLVLAGAMLAFMQAYAQYFLGGRYALLGNLLEAGPGGPFAPPPVFPSEEEGGDDDEGPPMLMDPAVA